MAAEGGPIRQLQVQTRALSRSEPDWRRILERHPVPRTARLAQSQSWGSLDRTSFNSIWRRVSIQVSVRHAHQERCSVSARQTVHDHAVPMPQSAGNDAKDLAQSRSRRQRAAAHLAESLHSWLLVPGPKPRPAVPAQVGRRG